MAGLLSGAPCGQTRRSKILQISVQLRILAGRGLFSWRFRREGAVRRGDGHQRPSRGRGAVRPTTTSILFPQERFVCSTNALPRFSSCLLLFKVRILKLLRSGNNSNLAARQSEKDHASSVPVACYLPGSLQVREETTSANKWQGDSQI